MTKVKEYLFNIPVGKEGNFCNMLTGYKSLSYIISTVDDNECRAYVQFSRPTSIPQKKLQDIEVVELLPSREENIDYVRELGDPWMEMNFGAKRSSPKKEDKCVLNIYSKLQKIKTELVNLLNDLDKRIEELHSSEGSE